MRKIVSIVLLAIIVSCSSRKKEEAISLVKLTISSTIDKETQINQEIIKSLTKFLETKNNSHYENDYWLQDDFKTFYFPYLDIYKIERRDSVSNFYQPTLLEIINTPKSKKKLLKIAFIGHDETTKENMIKSIYNILATKTENQIVFSNPLHYLTNDWSRVRKGNIQYVISPQKEFNEEEAKMQLLDIVRICKFYNANPLSITYYSCINAKELFQIKGFDYTPTMYFEGGGGLSSHHNIIFSANSSEIYTHEILHLYNIALFPSIPKLINEGMATYVGGSRTYSYSWHRENLKNHLEIATEIDLSKHLEPFERFYAGKETSIPYMIGALICERTYRLYGKEKLLTLLSGESEFWKLLYDVGLTKENINAELKKELLLPPTLYNKS